MKIGIDSFSYHRYFGECSPYEQPLDLRWDTRQFLERAHELAVEMVSLQTAYLSLEDTAASLRPQLETFGLTPILAWGHPKGLDGGSDPEKVEDCRRGISFAKELGCPIVRFVTGNQYSWDEPTAPRLERLIPIIRDLAKEAEPLTLAWENHADFTAETIAETIEKIGAGNLGMCFDVANTVRVGGELLSAARRAMPHIRMVHCRDMVLMPESIGKPTVFWAAAPAGQGDLPLDAFFDLLRASGYAGGVFAEFTNLHPRFPNEDEAVAQTVDYLRKLTPPPTPPRKR